MGYLIGAGPLDPAVKRYNGGTSSFTMDNSGTTNGTLLWVDGVAQVPGTDYNVSGTTITTTTAAGAGTNNVTSLQLFQAGVISTTADNTVATAKIQDDAVTLAKMAAGTDGNIISYDASGNPVAIATGNDGQVLTSAGAGAQPAFESAGFTLGTEQATTSGTTFTFGSIPSGVKQIDLMFNEVSKDAASDTKDILVQLGDAGGIETSGYLSAGLNASAYYVYSSYHTTGMAIHIQGATLEAEMLISGTMSFHLEDATANTWVQNHTLKVRNFVSGKLGYGMSIGGGVKSLSGELTQLMLLNVDADDFDAGAINIKYM